MSESAASPVDAMSQEREPESEPGWARAIVGYVVLGGATVFLDEVAPTSEPVVFALGTVIVGGGIALVLGSLLHWIARKTGPDTASYPRTIRQIGSGQLSLLLFLLLFHLSGMTPETGTVFMGLWMHIQMIISVAVAHRLKWFDAFLVWLGAQGALLVLVVAGGILFLGLTGLLSG